jgi:hypothetical protein
MRQHYFLTLCLAAGVSAASGVGLMGCTAKTEVKPGHTDCSTTATVRLCHGFTAFCLTEHTTLELADGTRLRPSGPVWEAYEPRQADGQVISIGYTLGKPVAPNEPGSTYATITCLQDIFLCGTPGRAAENSGK